MPAKVVGLADGFKAALHRSHRAPFPRSGSRPGGSTIPAKRTRKGELGQLTMLVAQKLGRRFHRRSRASSAARQCPCGPPHNQRESSSFRPRQCDVDTEFLKQIGPGTAQPQLFDDSDPSICAEKENRVMEEGEILERGNDGETVTHEGKESGPTGRISAHSVLCQMPRSLSVCDNPLSIATEMHMER